MIWNIVTKKYNKCINQYNATQNEIITSELRKTNLPEKDYNLKNS